MPSPRLSAEGELSEAPPEPVSQLDRDAIIRIVSATTAVVATSDRHGERDIDVLVGSECFLRVLDADRFAYPDQGLEPVSASRANLAEVPEIAMLLVGPGGAGGRRGLHLNGTAQVVPAEALRAEHPDLPTRPGGRAVDVWVVVTVGDAYPLDGADVPPFGPAAVAALPAPGVKPPAKKRRRLLLVGGVLLLALALLLVGVVSVAGVDGAPTTSAATGAPTGPPTLYGQVVDIPSVDRVVVDVGGTPVTVDVVGIDEAAVPPCNRENSLGFARFTLTGKRVTVVPDPTLPPGPGTSGYVVLDTQFSYTDAAIQAGASPAAGPSQYRAVFDREQADARDNGVGMWGPPCVR